MRCVWQVVDCKDESLRETAVTLFMFGRISFDFFEDLPVGIRRRDFTLYGCAVECSLIPNELVVL